MKFDENLRGKFVGKNNVVVAYQAGELSGNWFGKIDGIDESAVYMSEVLTMSADGIENPIKTLAVDMESVKAIYVLDPKDTKAAIERYYPNLSEDEEKES